MGTINSEGFTRYVYSAPKSPCKLQNRVSDRGQNSRSEERFVEELKSINLDDPEALKKWAEQTIENFESPKKVTRTFQGT